MGSGFDSALASVIYNPILLRAIIAKVAERITAALEPILSEA
jgi:hypothetical protein